MSSVEVYDTNQRAWNETESGACRTRLRNQELAQWIESEKLFLLFSGLHLSGPKRHHSLADGWHSIHSQEKQKLVFLEDQFPSTDRRSKQVFCTSCTRQFHTAKQVSWPQMVQDRPKLIPFHHPIVLPTYAAALLATMLQKLFTSSDSSLPWVISAELSIRFLYHAYLINVGPSPQMSLKFTALMEPFVVERDSCSKSTWRSLDLKETCILKMCEYFFVRILW